jgi:hypothetical protein
MAVANEGLFSVTAPEYIPQEALRAIPEHPGFVVMPPDRSAPVRGVRMAHGVQTVLYYVQKLPFEQSAVVGITFSIVYAIASANNVSFGGGKVLMEAVAAPLVSGLSSPDDSAITEDAALAAQSQDLPTSPGVIVIQELAVPVAKLAGPGGQLAAGDLALVRVRRLGDDARDTHVGDILFISMSLRNT